MIDLNLKVIRGSNHKYRQLNRGRNLSFRERAPSTSPVYSSMGFRLVLACR